MVEDLLEYNTLRGMKMKRKLVGDAKSSVEVRSATDASKTTVLKVEKERQTQTDFRNMQARTGRVIRNRW